MILRNAMQDRLPQSVLNRKDKLGFPAPLAQWLREELRDWVRDILLSTRARRRGLLNPKTVCARLDNHIDGSADHTWEIWRWLSLEIWFREFIDQPN